MRDDLLPRIFRAFAIFNGSLYQTDIHITVVTLRMALTCLHPDMVEVRYLSDRLVRVETFQQDERQTVGMVGAERRIPTEMHRRFCAHALFAFRRP